MGENQMYISRRNFIKGLAASCLAVSLSGCSASSVLNGKTSVTNDTKKMSSADMKTLLTSFIEVSVQPEIRNACFLDPNVLQIGNHVVYFPCSLQEFMDETSFESDNDLTELLSAGETQDIIGVLDGSEYSLTTAAKQTENQSTNVIGAYVQKDSIESERYGYKAFIYPGGVRPSFTQAQELVDVFGTPSHVNSEEDENENENSYNNDNTDTTAKTGNLIYKYYLTLHTNGGENNSYNASEDSGATEIGVNYYIDRKSGLVTKVLFTPELKKIIQEELSINGKGTLNNNNIVPTFNGVVTTDVVDGDTVIWKPYAQVGKYYSVNIFTSDSMLYQNENSSISISASGSVLYHGENSYSYAPLSQNWYSAQRDMLDKLLSGMDESSSNSMGTTVDVTSETTTQEEIAAQYMEDISTTPEEVTLLKLDGYTVVTNTVGYVGYKCVSETKDQLTFMYCCNTDVRPNNGDKNAVVYLELRRAQRSYGISDSSKLNDSSVISTFKAIAADYAVQMLKENS